MKKLIQRIKKAIGLKVAEEQNKPFEAQANGLTRYIYLNPGLNRHERRSLEAKIRSCNRKRQFNTNKIKVSKWKLGNTPHNVPAKHGWLIENSKRLLENLPIKIFSKSSYAERRETM